LECHASTLRMHLSMDSLRICIASAEVAPLAKTGGLADVSAALAAELHRRGHDVRLVMPLYRRLRTEGRVLTTVPGLERIELSLGSRTGHVSVLSTPLPGSDFDVWCIDCPELYDRDEIYTGDDDEHLRFAVLARATLAACQQAGWAPDIVHGNDWHVGLLPLFLRQLASWEQLFARTRSLMTIHNIGYQGVFRADVVGDLGLNDSLHMLDQDDLAAGRVNFLRTGLRWADAITTVSSTYAREIQGEERGMGLDGLLRERSDRLVGIANGVDYAEWSPEVDPLIPQHFSAKTLDDKHIDTLALLATLKLPPPGSAPVYGIVSRMAWQKGFELLFETLPPLLANHDARLVVLGSGERKYVDFFKALQQSFPRQVAYVDGYNEELAHLIEAGSDVFLMPSRYEPCGLNQMYSLRYGTIPIVRKTGGLADTVSLFDPSTGEGTGIVFEHFNKEGMAWALETSLSLFSRKDLWRRCQLNGMAEDFSWQARADVYVELYRRLLASSEVA
ncbi:MAG: starch synthase, partial [Pseudohongiellaceae bacterium]